MRTPQLKDLVYHKDYGSSPFLVLGCQLLPSEQYPTYTIWNVATQAEQPRILAPIDVPFADLRGIPIKDIELHFDEVKTWDRREHGSIVLFDCYDSQGWKLDFEGNDPEPADVDFFHELQQHHRGYYGSELPLPNG